MPYAGAPCTAAEKASPAQVAAFTQFDRELRAALTQRNPAALAFLVRFPLRVNTSRGTILIPDARSLAGHYAEIFPPALQDRILKTKAGDYICRYDEGVGYKGGAIWISTDDHEFLMDAVNEINQRDHQLPAMAYSCNSEHQRFTVTETANSVFTLRVWAKPKFPTGPPTLVIHGGSLHFEGTGVCSYSIYEFAQNGITYELEDGLGCSDGDQPKGATGSVTITNQHPEEDWCF